MRHEKESKATIRKIKLSTIKNTISKSYKDFEYISGVGDWSYICSNNNIDFSDEFINIYKEQINWKVLCSKKILPESIIRKYLNYINFEKISEFQNLSNEFIEEFKDRLNWKHISRYQKLSIETIEKNIEKIDFYLLSDNNKVSEEILERYCDKLNFYFLFSHNRKFSENFIENHINDTEEYNYGYSLLPIIRNRIHGQIWEMISSSQDLNEDFIERHKDLVNWKEICSKQKIGKEIIDRNIDKINLEAWEALLFSKNITKEILEQYYKIIPWKEILERINFYHSNRFPECLTEFISKKIYG